MKYLLALFLSVFAGSVLADGITIRSGDGHGTNTLFYDSSGVLSLGVTARQLFDGGGTQKSLDWDARVAFDTVNVSSVLWSARQLNDSAGAASLNWDTRVFSGAWTFPGSGGTVSNSIALAVGDPVIGQGAGGINTTGKVAFLQGFGNGALVKISTNDASSLTNFALLTNSIGINFDGATAIIPTNLTRYLVVPYNCNIIGFTMLSDTTTISVVDVMRTTYALFDAGATHPVTADSIVASLPPTIGTSLYKTNVTSVSTWSASLTNNNVVAFRLITNTAATTLNLTLFVTHALQ